MSNAQETDPLVKVEKLTVHFDIGTSGFWGQNRLMVHAVDNISFEIYPGETLGLVGESGSGKSTTGRAILRRIPVVSGRIYFQGKDITDIDEQALRPLRRHMQLVFQDPYASLNPRLRIVDIVAEPLIVHGVVKNTREAVDRVAELLELVRSAAASASVSVSPGHWLSTRNLSSPTNPSPRWMFPYGLRW
jgi:peptide/nickel transport system ATP-binding protein